MSCFILLKGNSAEGEDVLWLYASVADSTRDGNERPETPQGPGNGGWLSCQSQLSESIPSQAPWHGLGNNLPAACPFPSHSQEHPAPRSNAIGTQAMPGAALAPCVRADVPGTLCPDLDPVFHPELSIGGRGEQVSKATAISNSPALGAWTFQTHQI